MAGAISAQNGKKGGRPKGTVSKSTKLAIEMREEMTKIFHKNFKPIIEGQMELAKGALVAENPILDQNTGKVVSAKVFKDKPDSSVARYMLDQIIGKAKETIEHQGNITGILQIVADLEK